MNGYTTVDMKGYNIGGSPAKVENIYNTMLDACDTDKPIFIYGLVNGTLKIAPANAYAYVTASDVPTAVVGSVTLSFASDDTVFHS